MSINVNEDVIGGGGLGGVGWGGGGGGGIFLIAILLIFLVMGGGFFGRHGGDGKHESCADLMTINRYGNYMDPQLAKIETEVACRTGAIQTQNAVDTGAVVHILDNQTCQIKEGLAAVLNNQNILAREQEVMMLNNQIANLRDDKLELKAKLLQQETVNTIQGGNCQLNHRLDRMECEMAKRPPFYTAGGFPHTQPFNFNPAPFNSNCNSCC